MRMCDDECVRVVGRNRDGREFLIELETPSGTVFDEVVDAVYAEGDETGTTVDFCRLELYAHLYTHLDGALDGGRIVTPVEIGLMREGDVHIYADDSDRSE